MSSQSFLPVTLFKYPSQTVPVKIGSVKRGSDHLQTCKERERAEEERERERERECEESLAPSPRDGSHFRREEMRGEREVGREESA